MTYIIAEIGINHNGDIHLAKQLMRKAADAGCDAVKFQKRTVDVVYTEEELDAPRDSPWGTTNREQKLGLEFDASQYDNLEKYAHSCDLDFIVSCWDTQSVDLIEDTCNVQYHKIASAMATDRTFLHRINSTGKPVILSVGMCSEDIIRAAMDTLFNVKYILACTSTYPTKPEEVNLRHIETLKKEYPQVSVGFSNHYNGLDACTSAVALGAECIEFHITADRTMYGSDQVASIENANALVESIRNVEKMVGDGKKVVYPSEVPIAKKLRKVNNLV